MERRISKKMENYLFEMKDKIKDKMTEIGLIHDPTGQQLLQYIMDYEHPTFDKVDFKKKNAAKILLICLTDVPPSVPMESNAPEKGKTVFPSFAELTPKESPTANAMQMTLLWFKEKKLRFGRKIFMASCTT